MASRTPIVRQISWLGAVSTFAVGMLLLFGGRALWGPPGVMAGVALFVGLRLVLWALPRDHRRGIAHVRRHRFEQATTCFARSLEFFDSCPWIDDYRGLLLLSPSAASYREMALANMGYCYGQLGDGANARRCYETCLERFPDSGIAQAALNLLNSASKTL